MTRNTYLFFSLATFFVALVATAAVAYAQVGASAGVSVTASVNGSATSSDERTSGEAGAEGRANAETKMEVGVGMKAESANTKEERKESGEKGGTADINIGVGENQAQSAERNETDLEFAGKGVSASAIEVRGWDATTKQEFLAEVKAHAQVQSNQDLENFAKGILIEDENVTEVEADENEVTVQYRVPAKFLGIFSLGLPVSVTIEAHGEGAGASSVSERVKVKFPWQRIFFSIDESVREEALRQVVSAEVEGEVQTATTFEVREQARLFQLLSNVLKRVRDASLEANANADAEGAVE